jgi:large subunit ribosomal protein L31
VYTRFTRIENPGGTRLPSAVLLRYNAELADFKARRLVFQRQRRRIVMKTGIHPEYKATTITCGSCGHVYHTRSTSEKPSTEICGQCHPFFTGKQKLLDSAGRVDKFMTKYGLKK